MRFFVVAMVVSVVVLQLGLPGVCRASYAFYVGNKLTADGSVLVGGTGEEVSSHWLTVVPRRRHPRGTTVEVGVTAAAKMPGVRTRIPQARHTWRHLAMRYTDYKGFPPPLINGGLNEHQVAIRDVWSPSRKELVALTPRPQRGPNYSDLARIALERARTAREAVTLIGALIERHGYSTYGGNSHLIADPNEGWVLIAFAGGQRLWVARRLGPREIRVLYPGYIGVIPRRYRRHRDYMGAKHLIRFAVQRGWYKPAPGKPFNVYKVYGLGRGSARAPGLKYVGPGQLERELRRKAPKITLRDMMAAVRDPRIADEEAGYGQVAHLRRGLGGDLATLWVAPTGSVTSPFVPYRVGVQEVPPEYRQHRYLTKGAATHFLHPDFQSQEGTRFAGRLFKRLLYHTCAPEEVLARGDRGAAGLRAAGRGRAAHRGADHTGAAPRRPRRPGPALPHRLLPAQGRPGAGAGHGAGEQHRGADPPALWHPPAAGCDDQRRARAHAQLPRGGRSRSAAATMSLRAGGCCPARAHCSCRGVAGPAQRPGAARGRRGAPRRAA